MTTNPPATGSPGTSEPLEPPAAAAEFTLSAPAPVVPVAPAAAESMVPLDQSVVPELNQMVDDFVAQGCRLARAVRAQQRNDAALGHLE